MMPLKEITGNNQIHSSKRMILQTIEFKDVWRKLESDY